MVVRVSKLNEVYLKINCDSGIERELYEFFSFYVPNFRFMPAYRSGQWNGKVYLFNQFDYTIYVGLLHEIRRFCDLHDYECIVAANVEPLSNHTTDHVTKFYKTLKLPFEIRDYQINALQHAVNHNRAILLSPTASGKSAIIYGITRFFNSKTLIIVPTISLVTQMYSDFVNYSANDSSFNASQSCYTIHGGQAKLNTAQIIITTWQSIYKLPQKWFSEFNVVIGDEVHLFKAKSLVSIMCKLKNTKYRFGTTGTLDGTFTNKLVLEGLFGKTLAVTSTKELMDNNHLANLNIKCLVLKYNTATSVMVKNLKYADEISFIINHKKRNKLITHLSITRNGNVLLLFQYVEKHGKILYQMILDQLKIDSPNRKVFFVAGETDAEARERVRSITEHEKNAIIVASSGVFSTGVNIRNLDNIIFASPTKSRIRVLQSIGRILRRGDNLSTATVYDLVDDMRHKSHTNFALKHFIERSKIYATEKFNFRLHEIQLEVDK